jgi:hypothetical protein
VIQTAEIMYPKKRLVYTIAIDAVGSDLHFRMAAMLARSLVSTCFIGDIIIFTNLEKWPKEHVPGNVKVIVIQATYVSWAATMDWKWTVANLIDSSNYQVIYYIDADCIALRSIDHLFIEGYDFMYQQEPGQKMKDWCHNSLFTTEELTRYGACGGVNGGTLICSGNAYSSVMQHWAEYAGRTPESSNTWGKDQSALNLLVAHGRSLGYSHRPIEHGEIQFPLIGDTFWVTYMQSALLHAAMGEGFENAKKKHQFLSGIEFQRYFYDICS